MCPPTGTDALNVFLRCLVTYILRWSQWLIGEIRDIPLQMIWMQKELWRSFKFAMSQLRSTKTCVTTSSQAEFVIVLICLIIFDVVHSNCSQHNNTRLQIALKNKLRSELWVWYLQTHRSRWAPIRCNACCICFLRHISTCTEGSASVRPAVFVTYVCLCRGREREEVVIGVLLVRSCSALLSRSCCLRACLSAWVLCVCVCVCVCARASERARHVCVDECLC